MIRLLTSRLELAPLRESDADGLLELFNDVDVGRYLLDGQPVDRAWVEAEIASSAGRFAEASSGLWAIRERSASTDVDEPVHAASIVGPSSLASSPIIGVVGYRPFFDPPELQLLYALHPSRWGRGMATEASRAAMDHAFRVLGFDEVRAATDEPNRASVAVMERLGMELWKIEEGEPHRTLFFRARRGDRVEGRKASL